MKKALLLLIYLLTIFEVRAQWYTVATIPYEGDCQPGFFISYKFKFLNPEEVYWYLNIPSCSVSTHGYFHIKRTNNSFSSQGGLGGLFCSSLSSSWFNDLDIVSYDTVFFYGNCTNQIFVKTNDSGNSWSYLDTTNRPSDIYFLNGHLGYGFDGDSIYRFYNDSLYFITEITNFYMPYKNFQFIDSTLGFAFLRINSGDPPYKVIRTTDAGLTWADVIIDSNRKFYFVEFLNSFVGYIYADSSYLFKTTNGGNSWVQLPHNDSIGTIHFLNEAFAYSVNSVSGNNYYNVSLDSGYAWSSIIIPNGFTPNTIKMFNDTVGYILGFYYTGWPFHIILKTINGGVGFSDLSLQKVEFSFFPNPTCSNSTITFTYPSTSAKKEIIIYSIHGKEIARYALPQSSSTQTVKLPQMAGGVYVARMVGEGVSVMVKFVVE
jgi:hypothetical protein